VHTLVDPWEAIDRWWPEALASEPDVPDAMQIATVGADGRPTLRTVLLKEFGPDVGFVFFTNYGSRKASDLAATGVCAALLHWKSLQRQVIAEGRVHRADASTSDAYFHTRPRGSQIGAWASDQSRGLSDRVTLERRVAEVEARYAGREVPRPPTWGGFHLVPDRFEFWQGRTDRLHERVEFTRTPTGWTRRLLYP